MGKKILIIGNSAKVYSLARKLSKDNEVYVAPGSQTMNTFATCVDIREDSVSELLEFALENGIELTIPASCKTISTDIVDIFNNNGLLIFAPSQDCAKVLFDKVSIKRVLYKLRIPTPKFGIFEKQNMAQDYIKNLKQPFVIKTKEPSSAVVLTSQKTSRAILDSTFSQQNPRVLIEDYIWGTPFSFYVITDGYKALPLGSSIIYKHSLEGGGGQLTDGMGACVPNYKLSLEQEYYLVDSVIYPILEYMESTGNPYLGVLGVNGIISEEGSIQILGFNPFMQDCDTSAILEILDEDLCSLIQSCVVGSFSDEIEEILLKNFSAISLVLQCKNKENQENIINGLDDIDEDIIVDFYSQVKENRYLEKEAENGSVLVLTSVNGTVSTARANVYDAAKNIKFNGVSYRKDISKPLGNDL